MQKKKNLYRKSRYYRRRQQLLRRIYAAIGGVLLLVVIVLIVRGCMSRQARPLILPMSKTNPLQTLTPLPIPKLPLRVLLIVKLPRTEKARIQIPQLERPKPPTTPLLPSPSAWLVTAPLAQMKISITIPA